MPIYLIDKIKQKNGGSFALLDAADIEMADGTRLDAVLKEMKENSDNVSATTPVFDLGELGLTAIEMTGGSAELETDTSEIWEALEKGAVTFGIPVLDGETTLTGYFTMSSFTDGESMYQCVGLCGFDELLMVMVIVIPEGIIASLVPFSWITGVPTVSTEDDGKVMKVVSGEWVAEEETKELPGVTENDNGKFLQVVDGAWAAVQEEEEETEEEKRVTSVDLSNYDSGTIVETYSDGSELTYTFEFDSDGNPTKITDSDGNETVLTW